MEFEIVNMNIAEIGTDAIVLPANKELKEGPGASKAIFEAAGRKELTRACHELGGCEAGCAVVTWGFKLKAKYVVHAVVPKWVDGSRREYELLCQAYLSSLLAADALSCSSIAFPLLGSGFNCFDLELAFEIAKRSILSFQPDHLNRVILVIYGNRISHLVREWGYSYALVPEGLEQPKGKMAGGALLRLSPMARKLIQELLMKTKTLLEDPETQKAVKEIAGQVVKAAIEGLGKKGKRKESL